MALLLHQIELLMPQDDSEEHGKASVDPNEPETTGLSPASKEQMCASYVIMEKLNRLIIIVYERHAHAKRPNPPF